MPAQKFAADAKLTSRSSKRKSTTVTTTVDRPPCGRKQCTGDSSIRANGMRTRAQRLTYTRGSRMTLGREGNRNVQNFPSFGRGFDLYCPRGIRMEYRNAASI